MPPFAEIPARQMLGSSPALDHSIDPDRTLGAEAPVDVSADSDIAVAQRVLRVEAEALMDLAAGLDDSFARAVDAAGRHHRPRRRHRHGQERPCRAEDRGDAGLHRHAGPVGPSGRGQPRRPRHDRPRRCGHSAVQLRRYGRAVRHRGLRQAFPHSADRHHPAGALVAGRAVRRGADPAAVAGSLPAGAGARPPRPR